LADEWSVMISNISLALEGGLQERMTAYTITLCAS